jgi:hypothetical protein
MASFRVRGHGERPGLAVAAGIPDLLRGGIGVLDQGVGRTAGAAAVVVWGSQDRRPAEVDVTHRIRCLYGTSTTAGQLGTVLRSAPPGD